jgi:GNAT superfamily N-acetyltransferase
VTRTRIRPLGPEDMDVFLTLVDAHADFEGLPRPTPEARERLVRDALGSPPRYRAFLATMDEKDVGYAITFEAYSSFLARPTLFLEDIFVLEPHRGRGFGGAMFRHLVREALRRDCGRMEWMVQEWNEEAIHFYQRRGAEPLSDWRSFRISRDQLVRLAEGSERGVPPS